MTQSTAIVKALAMEHGYSPQTPTAMYEAEWFHGMIVDVIEQPARFGISKDEPTQEEIDGCIALFTDYLERVEERLGDGRAHAAGDQITWIDFLLLASVTGIFENPNLKSAAIREAVAAKFATCANYQRVMAPMKELCASSIANIVQSFV